jgi:hypothetical protein
METTHPSLPTLSTLPAENSKPKSSMSKCACLSSPVHGWGVCGLRIYDSESANGRISWRIRGRDSESVRRARLYSAREAAHHPPGKKAPIRSMGSRLVVKGCGPFFESVVPLRQLSLLLHFSGGNSWPVVAAKCCVRDRVPRGRSSRACSYSPSCSVAK